MNKKQIETLLNYVTIAMEQANQYKEIFNGLPTYRQNAYEEPLSQEEIDGLEIAHCDLELQLKKFKNTYKVFKMENGYYNISKNSDKTFYNYEFILEESAIRVMERFE